MRRWGVGLMLLAVAGCGTTVPKMTPEKAGFSAAPPFKVGHVEVWILPPERVHELCSTLMAAGSLSKRPTPPHLAANERYFGCARGPANEPTIISIADPYVLMHEFNDILSRDWAIHKPYKRH